MSRLHRNAELERRIQERIETRMATRWERKLKSTLRKASREAAAEYSRGVSIEVAVQKQNADIKKTLEVMYEQAFSTMGERIDRQWQSAKGYRPVGKKEMSDTFLRAMRAFIARWVAKKVVDISSATVNILQGVVQSAIEDGLSVADTAKIIRQKGEQFAGYRANLIARTEIHSASQAGSLSATQQVGGDIIKEWVPVMDDSTRDGDNSDFDHTNVESVPLNEPFIVSGEALMYPGDPSGSAGNVINCFVPDTRVRANVEYAMRSNYSGVIIKIITSRGSVLSVTPNHPILTNRGFVPAKDVNKQDNLVIYKKGVKTNFLIRIRSVYNKNIPTSIKDVFKSISLSGIVNRRMVGEFDLHGDAKGGDGYIDVVSVKRELLDNRVPSLGEHECDGVLSTTFVRNGFLPRLTSFFDFFHRTLSPSSGIPSSTTLSDNKFSVGLNSRPLESLRFGLSSKLDSLLDKISRNTSPADSENIRELIDRNSRQIGFDHIIDIVEYDFNGHVYDLQTKDGLIIADNIVVSNCRCAMTYIMR